MMVHVVVMLGGGRHTPELVVLAVVSLLRDIQICYFCQFALRG